MKRLISTHRSLVLLAVLLTGILSSAFSDDLEGGGVFLFIAHVLLGIGGAYLLGASRRWHIAAWILVSSMIIFESLLIGGQTESMYLGLTARASTMGLLGLFLVVVLKYSLLAEGQVHRGDRIFAGICGYLLIALLWSNLYTAVEIVAPKSFTDPGGEALTRLDFLYFSLTSLTTLGYGDILPVSGPARIFSVLESVFGVLYLAIFISALVAIPGKKET